MGAEQTRLWRETHRADLIRVRTPGGEYGIVLGHGTLEGLGERAAS